MNVLGSTTDCMFDVFSMYVLPWTVCALYVSTQTVVLCSTLNTMNSVLFSWTVCSVFVLHNLYSIVLYHRLYVLCMLYHRLYVLCMICMSYHVFCTVDCAFDYVVTQTTF